MRKPPLRSPRHFLAQPETQHRYLGMEPARGRTAVSSGESFAELFEASLRSEKRAVAKRDPDVGELVQGEIVQIGNEYAFLDIGGKSEAMISLDELRGEDGELTVHIGDTLEGHVIGSVGKDGGLLISGRIQKGTGLSDQIRQAYSQGTPVQGLVTGVNKGGLDVDLGGVRAFLPSSQIELRYCQEITASGSNDLIWTPLRDDAKVAEQLLLTVDPICCVLDAMATLDSPAIASRVRCEELTILN